MLFKDKLKSTHGHFPYKQAQYSLTFDELEKLTIQVLYEGRKIWICQIHSGFSEGLNFTRRKVVNFKFFEKLETS